MKKILLFSIIGLTLAFVTNAQRIKNLEGSAAAFVGIKKMNVVFTFNDVTVGKFSEPDYIAKKVDEYNKKEAGKGDKWKESWEADKINRYPASFTELFEKNCDFALGKFPSEKYTMTINTTRLEPGYNIYISRRNAEIDIDVTVTETATKKVVASYKMTGAPGRTFGANDFDTGVRLEEAFAKAGKEMGKFMQKEMK